MRRGTRAPGPPTEVEVVRAGKRVTQVTIRSDETVTPADGDRLSMRLERALVRAGRERGEAASVRR